MIEEKVEIINNAGLHTRPAATIVKIAAQFESEFFIMKDGFSINGKSIIGVMTLAAAKGSIIKLTFDGIDEVEMSKAILEYFNRGFDEL
ncbi:MAG: HPr family phosphocarrier protein [Bacteroidetes bacterium]|nr:HPr family phosphocarrier protein [Bacteroidota bacterium]MBU1115072.1 HPr family phosphocarrier protein [Bacteroidota bacterium]MBU1797174.1 HPr family phosphocarrier protein [Bacteroidota bacterium]